MRFFLIHTEGDEFHCHSLHIVHCFCCECFQYRLRGMYLRWGLFRPSGVAMETVAKLVDDGKVSIAVPAIPSAVKSECVK